MRLCGLILACAAGASGVSVQAQESWIRVDVEEGITLAFAMDGATYLAVRCIHGVLDVAYHVEIPSLHPALEGEEDLLEMVLWTDDQDDVWFALAELWSDDAVVWLDYHGEHVRDWVADIIAAEHTVFAGIARDVESTEEITVFHLSRFPTGGSEIVNEIVALCP